MQKFNQFIGHNRTAMSLLLALIFLWLAKPTVTFILWGIPLIIFGEFIRTWSAGCINKEYEHLTIEGPYAYTRNPLYVGNFLLGIGFVIMGHHWIPFVLFLIFFFLIYRSTILDEENTLSRVFGQSFTDYKKRVPRFIPLIIPLSSPKFIFYWGRVFRHREHKAWLGIAAVLIFIIIKSII